MNSKECILISQVWLTEERIPFRDMLEISVEYCRLLNPNAYIILSGMGIQPTEKTLNLCDGICWNDEIIEPAGQGFPIMISKGLEHAKDAGFKTIFKFRGDAIILQKDIVKHCECVLEKENKELLITQETTRDRWIGDMVLYGNIDLLIKMFNTETWVPNLSGNDSLAQNYIKLTGYTNENWTSLLKQKCSFRDIPFFNWLDLRDNYDHKDLFKANLKYLKENNSIDINFKYSDFFYGRRRGIHLFDENNNPQTERPLYAPWMYERFFYE